MQETQLNQPGAGYRRYFTAIVNSNGKTTGFLRNQRAILAGSLPEIGAPLDDFLKTTALLDDMGIKYKINIASGAGFEYYTGLIFQLYIGKEKAGGGGRYDISRPWEAIMCLLPALLCISTG
jgi:histidyl-tRNA synthetase